MNWFLWLQIKWFNVQKGSQMDKFKIEGCAMKNTPVRSFFIRESSKCHVTAERPHKMLVGLVFISFTRYSIHCVVIVIKFILLYLQHYSR